MIKVILFLKLALLVFSVSTNAQQISDNERRGFDNLAPIFIDVDGDGVPDRIQPRTYQTYHNPPGKRLLNKYVKNWITFDLKTSTGKSIKSFFAYNYGIAGQGGSYWVYSLVPAGDVNKDGRTDLMFYSGDDTSAETVILLNKGKRFSVHSRKITDSDDWLSDL
ncbi:MAG: hypothetical protein KF831_11715 [Acidobacteria bacterium]|nr:hypothetical protein [Acidobacteriota bacterium]